MNNNSQEPAKMSDRINASKFLEDLALDKVIAEEQLQPQNVQTTKKPSDEKKDSLEENSYQVSWDFPHYLSDDDAEKIPRSYDEAESSVICSDSSFRSKI